MSESYKLTTLYPYLYNYSYTNFFICLFLSPDGKCSKTLWTSKMVYTEQSSIIAFFKVHMRGAIVRGMDNGRDGAIWFLLSPPR